MRSLCLAFAFVAAVPAARAASATANLTVTGMGLGVVTITLTSSGITVGSGTSVTTATLGTISNRGGTPTGWSRGSVSNGWKLTAPVTVTTSESLTGTTQAVLSAQLLSNQTGITWKVDTVTLSTTDTPIATEAYGAHVHNVSVEILNSVANGTLITNTITFTATAQ